MYTWLILAAGEAPLDMGTLRQAAYDRGVASDLETAGEDRSAFLFGPEGEEPRVEVSFRPIDRIDLRDRIAESESPPPKDLAPAVEQARLEYVVQRPVGFSLDENELCLALVALLAVQGSGVVWAPADKQWWSARAFAQRYFPAAL